MTKEAVYGYLRENKSALNDLLGRITTDLINIGGIPLESHLVGNIKNWRLLSKDDVHGLVRINEEDFRYLNTYSKDPTWTVACLEQEDDMPSDLTQLLNTIFSPIIKLWAKGVGSSHLGGLTSHQQRRRMDEYVNDLDDIEFLAYSALTLSVGENIGLLRGGEGRLKASLVHFESELAKITAYESTKIPQLLEELTAHKATCSAFEKERAQLLNKRDALNESINQSNQQLKLIYNKPNLYCLILNKEKSMKGEQDLKEKIEACIAEINNYIKLERMQMSHTEECIEGYQALIERETQQGNVAKKIASCQQQIADEIACKRAYDDKLFLPIAREKFKSMLSHPEKARSLRFLYDSAAELLLDDRQLDAILSYYAEQFKAQNYYAATQENRMLVPFTQWLQDYCRDGYQLARARLHLNEEDNSKHIKAGEFHCREIDQCIHVSSLKDASSFMMILLGAYYVAHHQKKEELPEEIISYVNELNDFGGQTTSTFLILFDAERALEAFIKDPTTSKCSELEKSVLTSILIKPALRSTNIRFFSDVTPNVQTPIVEANVQTEAVEPEPKRVRYGN